MARIVIMVDGEFAHVHPTLLLARHLAERGHMVWYLGLGPIKNVVISRGFRFIRIFHEVLSEEMTTVPDGAAVSSLFQSIVRGGTLREALDSIRPDVIVTLSLFSVIAILIQITVNIPAVLVRTHCTLLSRVQDTRRIIVSTLLQCCGSIGSIVRLFEAVGIKIHEVADLERLVLRVPELILLPKEFALPQQSNVEDGTVYVGPGVDVEFAPQFAWEMLNITGTLVYCSLGSHPDLELETSRRFFELVVAVITKHPEFYLLLSTGGNSVLASQLNSPARNVHITSWVPQLEILGRAGVVITHGGFGTIKECILMGVPMVVFPVMRDQFSGAERIAQLGLGVRGNIRNLSGEELFRLIRTVADNEQSFKFNVSRMQGIFRRSKLTPGVQIIEQIANRSASR